MFFFFWVRFVSFCHETKETKEQRETTPQLAYKAICKTNQKSK